MINRTGFTLIEMIVVIAILGVVAGLAAVSFRPSVDARADDNADIIAARRLAVQSGEPVTVAVHRPPRHFTMTARPDGSVLADTGLKLDPLTGRVTANAR